MSNLLQKASIVTTPTAYGVGVLNSIKPAIPVGDGDFDFTRTSSATRVNPDYLIETSATNIPRLDYTNGTASILLENQSTNLVTHSEDFTDSSWTKLGVGTGSAAVVTSNYSISPDGTLNATRLQCNLNSGTTNSDQSLIYNLYSSSSNQTISIYMKSNTGSNQNVYFANTVSTGDTAVVTSEWQRFTFSHSSSTYVLAVGLRGGTGADDTVDISIFAAQAEALSYATSYIPTNGSTQTRAAETLNNAGNSDLINSTEGVLYAEISSFDNSGDYRLISLSDGTLNNRIFIGFRLNTGYIYYYVIAGGVSQSNFDTTITSANSFSKIALKYKANDFALWVNGVEIYADSSGSIVSGLDTLQFANGNGTQFPFYGNAKMVAVFKEALSDTELACLTSTNNREIFLNYYYRMQYVGANTEALSCAEQTFNI